MGQSVKIFVSSPGDVGEERAITERVIERLKAEFGNRAELQAFLWEHDAVRATETPQAQFIRPSQADIVICILWARLGTRLPDEFERRSDGSVYESGTAFEFEDAKRGYDATGRPHLLVYRKTAEPRISFRDPQQVQLHVDQYQALERFFQRWFVNADGSLKGAFTPFADPDEYERRIYDHLRQILLRSIAAPSEGGGAATWHSGSPFRGLHTFEAEHAPVFFGRTRAISEVRNRFELQSAEGRAFVLVLGMSGSGKSSLMRAGLVPTISRAGVIEHVGFWRKCVLRLSECPGDVFLWLAQRLTSAEVLPELLEAGATVDSIATMLRSGPEHFPAILRMGLTRAAEVEKRRQRLTALAPGRLLLVIDQLEELFTLPAIDPATRQGFVRVLDALARTKTDAAGSLPLAWVGATMRSDFYHRLAEVPELVTLATGNGEYHLLPPRRPEIADIIRQPARIAGLAFETDSDGNTLDAELEDAAAQDPAALPLLQFVLDELYARRRDDRLLTFEAYREIGGLEGALAHRAEEVFSTIEPTVQAALPRVLRALVNLRESEDDKPIASMTPLASFVPGTPERTLVEAFLRSDARLLVVDGLGETAHLRVAHEALLSHWTRAKSQIDSERSFLRTRTRVQSSTAQWLARGRANDFLLPPGGPLAEAAELLKAWRDTLPPNTIAFIEASIAQERLTREQRVRRVRRIAMAMTGLAVVSIGLGLWAYSERSEAIANAAAARNSQRIALNAAETLVSEIARPLQTMAGASVVQIRGMLDRAEGIYRQLLREGDQTPSVRYSQAVMLLAFAEAHGALGKKDERLQSASDARDILLSLPADEIAQDDLDREISRSHIAVGDALRSLDRSATAQKSYQAALELRQRLQDKHTDSELDRRNMAVALERIGDIERDEGRTVAALERYSAALTMLEAAGSGEVRQPTWQRERAVLHNKIGDMLLEQDAVRALASYESGKQLIETARAAQPANLLLQQDLAESHEKLALAYAADDQLDDAQENIATARRLLERLHLQDPANTNWRRALATAYHQTGDILLQADYQTQAGLAYDRAIQLIEAAGEDLAWQRDLAVGYERKANLAFLAGDSAAAVELYESSLKATDALADREAASATWQRELMIGRYSLGRALLAADRSQDGAMMLAKAIEAGENLQRRNPENLRWRADLATVLNEYAWFLATTESDRRNGKSAVALAEKAVALTDRNSPALLDTLAMAHFANNERQTAIDTAREALALRGRVAISETVWGRIEANLQDYEQAQAKSPTDEEGLVPKN